MLLFNPMPNGLRCTFALAILATCSHQQLSKEPKELPQEIVCNEGKRTEFYNGPSGTKNIGTCTPGIQVCANNQILYETIGKGPSEELCNNEDDDCDGNVDEPPINEVGRECGEFKECTRWSISCKFGKPECLPFPGPFAEICNGVDDDCDGSTDEDCAIQYNEPCDGIDNDGDGITDPIYDSSIPCYSGSDNTSGRGICRPGIYVCLDGALDTSKCLFEIKPRIEQCSDGLDNDCDGYTDEELGEEDEIDILFIIDMSESMTPYLENIFDEIHEFVNSHDVASIKFGFISVGDFYHLRYNLGDAQQFLWAIETANLESGLNETTYDAIYQSVIPDNPMDLNWRDKSKKVIILFGDEPAQTALGLSEGDVKYAVVDYDVYIFTQAFLDYDDITDHIFSLEDGLAVSLGSFFVGICAHKTVP